MSGPVETAPIARRRHGHWTVGAFSRRPSRLHRCWPPSVGRRLSACRSLLEVMSALGFERFAVVGHDRGARVTWRLAVEHPDRVTRAAVIDIVPLPYSNVTQAFATEYFHWLFLIQPAPFPETLIGNSTEFYLRSRFLRSPGAGSAFTPEVVPEYLHCFRNPDTIHAACENYRAGATIDIEHASADGDRKVRCPLLVLSGARGTVGRLYDVMSIWGQHAVEVRGKAFDSGHFLAEEVPAETLAELMPFLIEA